MIRRIRTSDTFLVGGLFEKLRLVLTDPSTYPTATPTKDAQLGILLKHAYETAPAPANRNHILLQLTRRVQGPFGRPALEAPTFAGENGDVVRSGGKGMLAPFVVCSSKEQKVGEGTDSLWHKFHFVSCGFRLGKTPWAII